MELFTVYFDLLLICIELSIGFWISWILKIENPKIKSFPLSIDWVLDNIRTHTHTHTHLHTYIYIYTIVSQNFCSILIHAVFFVFFCFVFFVGGGCQYWSCPDLWNFPGPVNKQINKNRKNCLLNQWSLGSLKRCAIVHTKCAQFCPRFPLGCLSS